MLLTLPPQAGGSEAAGRSCKYLSPNTESQAAMPVLRAAVRGDIPALSDLIARSVRGLQGKTYTSAQIELALANVYGVDTVLIDDGTYFVIEDGERIIACGGWSKRAKMHGGDRVAGSIHLLDPWHEAAKIRAFFVHPDHVRRGLASLLLERCEGDAAVAGFGRAELDATLSGVPFYTARGYVSVGEAEVPLPHGAALGVVRMERALA